MPARLHSGASARTPPAAPSAARLLTNRHAQQQPQPPRGTLQASGAAAGSSALVNRCTSLTASERSYGSSLLSAAFERHDNRRCVHVYYVAAEKWEMQGTCMDTCSCGVTMGSQAL